MELSSCVSTEVIFPVYEMLMFYITQDAGRLLREGSTSARAGSGAEAEGSADAIWEVGPWGQVSGGSSMGSNGKVMHSGSSEKKMKLALWFEGRAEQEEGRPCLEVKANTVTTSRMFKHDWSASGCSCNPRTDLD